MDAATLSTAMNHVLNLDQYKALVTGANETLRATDCTTVDRAAMLLAQAGHESVGLKYSVEIHDGSNYEGRVDLGNTQPGDGKRFRGRGFIQCTGRSNYGQVSRWLHARGYVSTPTWFVDHPVQLGELRYAWLTVVWYWQTRNLNVYADRKDIVGATRVIQGAAGGLEDRRFRYGRCLALGKAILPSGKDELVGMDANDVERMIVNFFRSYHKGGDRGRAKRRKYGGFIKDADHGIGDRVYTLEQEVKKLKGKIK